MTPGNRPNRRHRRGRTATRPAALPPCLPAPTVVRQLYTFGYWWFSRAEQDGDIIRAHNLDPEVRFSAARYTADLLIPAAILVAGVTGIFRRQ